MSRIGGRKLHEMLMPDLLRQDIQIGRDIFFDLLRTNGFLIRRRRRKALTTFSAHWLHKYPNLIKDIIVDRPNLVWVSDITYIETDQGFMYLFLITDAYSRKIMGYYLSDNLRADGGIQALKIAINQSLYSLEGLIHHSDRGIQYCSQEYVKELLKHGISISMSAKGNPYENAIAERVNGILKDEWIHQLVYKTKRQAIQSIDEIIPIYNGLRPHSSCDMLTPEQAYLKEGLLKKRWKSYRRKKQTEPLTT
jgi:transposase InsO family protein